MAITVESGLLSRAMKTATTIVEATNTIPIMANVRLEAIGDNLEIVTSNMDIEYRRRLPLAKSGDLATTADARKLAAIAGASESGAQIDLEVKDGRMVAKSGRSRWLLPVLPVHDFPAMPLPVDTAERTMTISGKQLASIIARIAWSVETNEVRYFLCGVFAHEQDGKMRFAATNGATMATLTSDIAWPEGAPEIIIPTRLARTIERVMGDVEQVDISWDDRKLRVSAGDVTLTGKLVEGTFPDYRRIIPAAVDRPMLIDPEGLRKALRRMELVGSEKTRAIVIDVGQGAIELQMADGGGGGEANEHVPADCEAFHRVGFNSAYLASVLEAVGGDTVEVHQESPKHFALVRRAVDDGSLCVIGAMRV